MTILNMKLGTQPKQMLNPKNTLPKLRSTLASQVKNGDGMRVLRSKKSEPEGILVTGL
jgi:hypothetical protein